MAKWMHAVAALLVATLPASASAQCSGDTCSNVKITRLYIATDTKIYISVNTPPGSLICPDNYLTLAVPAPTDAFYGQFQAIFSTLLTRMQGGETVSIRKITGSPDCRIAYILADTAP